MALGNPRVGGKGGLFGHPPNDVNDVLGGIRIQTSILGTPIPIVYGRNRITGNLLDYFNFTATPQQHKGGKGGLFGSGAKGGQQEYDYGASVIIGLCQGPISGIGGVWDSQGTLPVNDTTETYTIGGGLTYTATQQNTYIQDLGVTEEQSFSQVANDYGSPGAVTISGTQQVPMKRVSGSPSMGEYSESGGVYTFSSADTGTNVQINYSYGPPNSIDSDPIQSYNLTIFDGTQGQTPWSYSGIPAGHNIGYTLLAYVATAQMDLGSSGVLPNLSYEIYGLLPYGQGTFDANPRDVIYDMMTNPIYGCGLVSLDVGGLTMPNWATNFSNYCCANGLFISPVLQDSQTFSDYLKDWLDATNGGMIRNGLALTIASYGDTTTVGNGATFIPPTNPIYNLDDDDFIRDRDELPIRVERPSVVDAYNSVKVQFTERTANYNTNQVEATYDLGIQLWKYRPESARDYSFFTDETAAASAATTILNRLVCIRNKWHFKLPQTYILLDPMDLVVLPAEPETNNVATPVRLTSIQEAAESAPDSSGDPKRDDLVLEIEAEDFPWGNCGPTEYPKQPGVRAFPNANADPGYVSPPFIFEPVPRLRGTDPNMEMWIALCGNSQTVAFSGGAGSGATAYAIITGGVITSVVMVDQGSGYTSAPLVSFGNSQNAGSGAAGTATISGGKVTGVTITSGGSGYATAWGGARVWMSTDGSTYYPVALQFGASIMGATVGAYPAHGDPDAVDNLTVDLSESGGTLASFSAEHENQYGSLSVIAGGYGNIPYELIAFGQVTLVSANEYELLASATGAVVSPYGPPSYQLQIAAPGSGYTNVEGAILNRSGNPIGAFTLTPGSGYVSGDVVTFTGSGVTTPATAVYVPGQPLGGPLWFTNTGAGFTAGHSYNATGGSGTGMSIVVNSTAGDCFIGIFIGNNAIGSSAVAFGGSGYLVGDTGTIPNQYYAGPVGVARQGTYTVTAVDTSGTYGEVQTVYNPGTGSSVGGSGYSVGNILTLTGGGGDAEVLVLTVSSGAVTSVLPIQGGSGYAIGTLYTCSGGGGTGCKLEVAQVNNGPGVVTGIEIADPGNDFSTTGTALAPYYQCIAGSRNPLTVATLPALSPGSVQPGQGAGLCVGVSSLVNGAASAAVIGMPVSVPGVAGMFNPTTGMPWGGSGYSSANGVSITPVSPGTGSGLAANIQAGSYIRRNVFGAPTGPSGGVNHPSGSQFCFLGTGPASIAPITKIKLDPSLVGQTVYFKFTSFNQRQNMEQSLAVVEPFLYVPTGLQTGLYGFAYSVTPNILSQPSTAPTTISILPFLISASFGAVTFNGTTLTGLSSSALYNVYVYQPSLQGEGGAMATGAQYEARTDTSLSTAAGWYFIGQIQMLPAGGGSQTQTGGQSTNSTPGQLTQTAVYSEGMGAASLVSGAYYLNYTTLFGPLVPGSISIAWSSSPAITITDDGAGHLYNGSTLCGTVNYAIGLLNIGPVATAAGSSDVPVSYRYY